MLCYYTFNWMKISLKVMPITWCQIYNMHSSQPPKVIFLNSLSNFSSTINGFPWPFGHSLHILTFLHLSKRFSHTLDYFCPARKYAKFKGNWYNSMWNNPVLDINVSNFHMGQLCMKKFASFRSRLFPVRVLVATTFERGSEISNNLCPLKKWRLKFEWYPFALNSI